MNMPLMTAAPSKKVQSQNCESMIVIGAQWGDEGKGKVIDFLAKGADTIVRSQGGNNAGHTVIIGEEEYKLHLVPSGILQGNCQCYLGGGVVVDPGVLLQEIQGLEERGITVRGRLWISPYANVIMPYHRHEDVLIENRKGKDIVGTTKRGIGPCYADKAHRVGIRINDLMDADHFKDLLSRHLKLINERHTKLYGEEPLDFEEIHAEYRAHAEKLRSFVSGDVEWQINEDINSGKAVLFEGAQGALLDNTYGTVPYVTSSCTLSGGICTGSAVGPTRIKHTLAVVKAYTTRVGKGPMPTELPEDQVFFDVKKGREVGTTTGRVRRVGWFDAVLTRTSLRMNGADSLALMKMDILDTLPKIKICTGYTYRGKNYQFIPGMATSLDEVSPVYEEMDGWMTSIENIDNFEDLPHNARQYIQKIAELCEVPVALISVGPARNQTIVLDSDWPISC